LLEAVGIDKVYPDGTVALEGVDVQIHKGEIHGLLGENGAGKTTLTKILSGLLKPTRGSVSWKGQPLKLKTPLDALNLGIGMVHQHFALVEPFTALENIALGQEGGKGLSVIDYGRIEEKLKWVMEEGGLDAPLDVPVELLPVGVQQRIEILKLLYREVELLILDEPTAVLTPQETDDLFETLIKLKKTGKTIIFITHKLREIMDFTDSITVIRRGRLAGSAHTSDMDAQKLATLMVGHEVTSSVERGKARAGETVLEVKNIHVKDNLGETGVNGIDFEVKEGEIFGIAGVEGNGQTELIEAITGLRPWENGTVIFDGEDIKQMDPQSSYNRGLAHIPEDRRRVGMILEFSLMENSVLGLQTTDSFRGAFGRLSWKKVRKHTEDIIEKFSVKTNDIKSPVSSLSGGNQQKLVVGRELSKNPKLIIAAQPTRGLDISATQFIRDLLMQLRGEGKAILLVSAELDEIFQLADRVGVIYEGNFTGIFSNEELDREKIGLLMGGVLEEMSSQ
jgi:simple sugar transport system ATP-binding protein